MSKACDSQESSGLSAALIPPCAALECERTGWTLLTMPTETPSSAAARAARCPARPAPITSTSCVGTGADSIEAKSDPAARICSRRRARGARSGPLSMLGGGGTITLFHVRGIRIAVDWSWFFVLFLVDLLALAVLRRRARREQLLDDARSCSPWSAPSASSARSSCTSSATPSSRCATGSASRSIQLWIFGGVARMDRESDSPATEFKVAIAGPAVTLAIFVALTAIGLIAAGRSEFRRRRPGRVQRPASPACWRWSPGSPRSTSSSSSSTCCRPSRWTAAASSGRSPGGGPATAPPRPASPPASAASSAISSSAAACC